VRGEHGEQAGQVGAVPVAGHVGLAEPDQAGGAEAAEEVPGPAHDHDRGGRTTRTQHLMALYLTALEPAVRQLDPQRQPGHRRGEQGAGHGRARRGTRHRGDVGPPVRVDRPGLGGLRADAGQ